MVKNWRKWKSDTRAELEKAFNESELEQLNREMKRAKEISMQAIKSANEQMQDFIQETLKAEEELREFLEEYDDEYSDGDEHEYDEEITEEGIREEDGPTEDMKRHPENYYIWRCEDDDRVRASHAERNGKVFCWDKPPSGGHPGEDYNCRCEAEEYFYDENEEYAKASEQTKYKKQELKNLNETPHLHFDGKNLYWIKDGKIQEKFDAQSGQEEYQSREFQNVANKGPLPEGVYHLRQSERQEFWRQSPVSVGLGVIKKGKWPGSLPAWGMRRVWLEPDEKNEMYGRSGLTIHGGYSKGSAGCIDIPWQTGRLWKILDDYGEDVIVNVKYPKSF